MKLHWNDQAIHALSILTNDPLCLIPLLMYPDCLANRTALLFPYLSVAIAADVNVSFALKFLSPLAKSGCTVSCLPYMLPQDTYSLCQVHCKMVQHHCQ